MRNLITALCVAAGVGAGGVAVAGCGAGDAVGLDAAKAAEATAQKKTARIRLKVSIEGAGLPLPVALDAKGVTALDAPRGKLTFDLGPLLGLAGAPPGTPGTLEMRFDGATLYAKPPKLDALPIPGGKPWVSLDLARLATALGLPAKGLGNLFTLEPAAQLRALEAAKGLEKVGEEEIAGAKTTHYRGTFRLADVVAKLPAGQRKEAQDALTAVEKLSPQSGSSFSDPVPADLWVDEDGVTRRLVSTAKLPAQGGQPGGTVKETYELSDFGVALDAAPPAARDTFDATGAATAVFRQVVTSGGTTP